MLPNQKLLMNEYDKKEFEKIKITKITKNKKIVFKEISSINNTGIFGLGWSYSYSDQALWSDGEKSTLIFSVEKDLDKFNIILDVEGYIMPKNKTQKVKIFINGVFNKELIFSENEGFLLEETSDNKYIVKKTPGSNTSNLNISSDSGTNTLSLFSETLHLSGGTGINTSLSGDIVTYSIDNTVATLTGQQTFTNKTINNSNI